eukprot:1341322-Ditylum_brightwellii.AAC.1
MSERVSQFGGAAALLGCGVTGTGVSGEELLSALSMWHKIHDVGQHIREQLGQANVLMGVVAMALFFGHLLKEGLVPGDDIVLLALVGVSEEHSGAEEQARVWLGSSEVLGYLGVHAERGPPKLFVEYLLYWCEGQGVEWKRHWMHPVP